MILRAHTAPPENEAAPKLSCPRIRCTHESAHLVSGSASGGWRSSGALHGLLLRSERPSIPSWFRITTRTDPIGTPRRARRAQERTSGTKN